MFRTEWTKCVSKYVSTNGLVALSNIHNFKPRSNTARKFCLTNKIVIRKIFWMYLYRNCLQKYIKKCVAFLELNGIKKKLSSLCQILAPVGIFCYLMGHVLNSREVPRSAKSSRRSLETRDWRKFSLFMRQERNVQAVRNIDFSYFINQIRNSSTLRPLELDV